MRESLELEDLVLELSSTLLTQKLKAIKGLGELRNQSATDHLLPFLQNKSKALKIAAIKSLGKIGSKESLEPLLGMKNDGSPDIRYNIAVSLGFFQNSKEIKENKKIDQTLKELSKDRNLEVATQAIGLLAKNHSQNLKDLIELLDHQSWQIRQVAASAIGRIGEPAIGTLKIALNHERSNTRYWVCQILGRFRKKELAPFLIKKLQDPDDDVKMGAISALGKLRDTSLIPVLLGSLQHFPTAMNDAVSQVLLGFGPELLPHLIHLLKSESYQQRVFASNMLINFPDKKMNNLVENIQKGNHNQTYWILKILGQIKDQRTIPLVKKFLDSDNQDLILAAISALGEFKLNENIPELTPFFDHKIWIVRLTAAQVCASYGAPAVSYLVAELKSKKSNQRYWSTRALGIIADKSSLLAIENLLTDKEWSVRLAASTALLNFGGPGWEVLDRLARGKDLEKKYWALKALVKLNRPQVVDLFLKGLVDGSDSIRAVSAEGLVNLGIQTIPFLLGLLNCKRRETCIKIVDILVGFGEESRVHILKNLAKCDDETNFWLGQALRRFPKDSTEEVAELTRHKSFEVRLKAVEIIGQLPFSPLIQKVLIPLLKDEFWPMRTAATRALGMGKYLEAVPEIIDNLDDENTELAIASAEALGKIGDSSAVNPLIYTLHHESGLFRRVTVRALSLLGDSKCLKELEKLFYVSEEDLQLEILYVFNRMKGAFPLGGLEKLINPGSGHPNLDFQLLAIENFQFHPTENFVAWLPPLLQTSYHWQIREGVLKLIEDKKIQSLSKEVLSLVGDEDFVIREAASKILKEIVPKEKYQAVRNQLVEKQKKQRELHEEVLKGQTALKEKRYPDALEHFLNASEKNPQNRQIRSFLGTSYFKTGQLLKATEIYEKLVEEDGYAKNNLLSLSTIYIKRKCFKEARNLLNYLISISSPQDNYAQLAHKMLNSLEGK